MAKRDAVRKESRGPTTWRRRGKTYVASTTSGLGRLDEDRAESMTDEGGPALPARAAGDGRG
jgi:hypothetical protein